MMRVSPGMNRSLYPGHLEFIEREAELGNALLYPHLSRGFWGGHCRIFRVRKFLA